MFDSINSLITLLYLVLTIVLFNHSTVAEETLYRRIKFSLLAISFMCFGLSRIKYLYTYEDNDWIIILGHLGYICFGIVYFSTGYCDVRKLKK